MNKRAIDPAMIPSIRASLLRYRSERLRLKRLLKSAEKEIRLYGPNAPPKLLQAKRDYLDEQRKRLDLLNRLTRQGKKWLAEASEPNGEAARLFCDEHASWATNAE